MTQEQQPEWVSEVLRTQSQKTDSEGKSYTRAYSGLIDWKTPEVARENFEHRYEQAKLFEREVINEDGSSRTLVLYEVTVDVADPNDRRDHMGAFLLQSEQAGYKEARSPVVLPTPNFVGGDPKRPITAVYFTLEKPATQPQSNAPRPIASPPSGASR